MVLSLKKFRLKNQRSFKFRMNIKQLTLTSLNLETRPRNFFTLLLTKINRKARTFFFINYRRFCVCFRTFLWVNWSSWNFPNETRDPIFWSFFEVSRVRATRKQETFHSLRFYRLINGHELKLHFGMLRVKSLSNRTATFHFYCLRRASSRRPLELIRFFIYNSKHEISTRWFLRRPSSFFVAFPP